ncbi:Cytochrome c554 and c-prime [Colwellia chukchiensis]|uniref:Cytochrome c554 and c-prime n=1 Tax=Colwellia chukchiensis TaxID=641665 RepID=A0A1H7M1I8_9GAMM|nr:multiheme c-type cytochrome [Colwellia chukchiensis]SEL04467.1 Cytochrome c554 and c-prime [Colwellia chukchiensis]
MRWTYFIVLQIAVISLVVVLVYKHQSKVALVKLPPPALAQWYKPENKRQVWLHNMFKLRRELQAVQFYAQQQNSTYLKPWSEELAAHYLKIGEMVPSWQHKLDKAAIAAITTGVNNQNYDAVLSAINSLQRSCDACHDDYRAVTALTYRSADFSNITIEAAQPFNRHMASLSKQVNQIKIASQDNMPELAISSLQELKLGMNALGQTCRHCHKNERKNYPNEAMQQTLINLEQSLNSGTIKEQARALGTLAVQACARCHGTHRVSADSKKLLLKQPTLLELLRH